MVASVSALPFNSLPIPRTRLIGREAELASAPALLLEEAVPLLTLTAPGSVGKTRLALRIADDVGRAFADGVVWVDLSPLRDPVLVISAVASAIGAVTDRARLDPEDLARHLRPCQVLLLLDNCEHLL